MKRGPLVLLTMVLVLGWALPAGAQATRTSWTSVLVFEEVVDPGEVRVTPGGILIVRGQVIQGTEIITVDGEEFPGVVVLSANVNLNLATGQGALFGTFELDTPGLDTWTGNVQGMITAGLSSGSFVGHGVGGTKQTGTFTEIEPGVFNAEGVILEAPGLTL